MQIYLVRHAESQANIDPTIYRDMADHAIPLSKKGHKQAIKAGKFLRHELESLRHQRYIAPSDEGVEFDPEKVRLWMSPYTRTVQTAEHILDECGDLIQSAHKDIALCEQQFGLFDGIPDEDLPSLFPNEHQHYQKCEEHEGKFYARMPLGESRFDVALRVRSFIGSIHRDADKHGIETVIVVMHGVSLRCLVMSYLHLDPLWTESEPNPENCAVRLITNNRDAGYIFKP